MWSRWGPLALMCLGIVIGNISGGAGVVCAFAGGVLAVLVRERILTEHKQMLAVNRSSHLT